MTDIRNRIQLVGNLGMDPEMVNFDNGNKLVKFSLATNTSYRDQKGEYQKDTQWHNIVAWGKLAEMVKEHYAKGDELAMEGRLTYRSYEDKNGTKKYITEIVMGNFIVAPKMKEAAV